VSLPVGFDSAGLSLAIQLIATFGADAALIRITAAFERARSWAHRRPVIS